ncbi:MAG: cytochrome C assembly family protein [Bacilli bacterium]
MPFILSPVFYGAMLLCYLVGLGLFYVDFLKDNRIANRFGIAMLCVVWLMETAFLGVMIKMDHLLPFFSSAQGTIFFSWLLITVSIVVNYLSRIDYFSFLMNLLGFLFVAFATFAHGQPVDIPFGQGDLLLLHISVAFLSYIMFTLSFIFSVLYLLADSALRFKRFQSGPFRRLPPLQRLDLYAYRSAVAGLPLLLIAMILGSVWYALVYGYVLILDPKPLFAIVLAIMYVIYLYMHSTGRLGGRKASWWNLACFLAIVLNFLVVGQFASQLHR